MRVCIYIYTFNGLAFYAYNSLVFMLKFKFTCVCICEYMVVRFEACPEPLYALEAPAISPAHHIGQQVRFGRVMLGQKSN